MKTLNRLSYLEKYLEKGGDIEAKNKLGFSILQLAIWSGDFEMTKFLIKSGANLNSIIGQKNLAHLHLASRRGNLEIVQLLLSSGANVNEVIEENGWTSLHYAVMSGRVSVIRELLNFGANIEARSRIGQTALHIAVQNGYPQVIRELLQYGADTEVIDGRGRKPSDLTENHLIKDYFAWCDVLNSE